MAIITVMYPTKAGSKFDMDYYLNKHMKLVADTWTSAGLRGYTVLTAATPDAPYQVMVDLDFTSAAAFQAAVAATGPTVMGDVPNFTDLQPLVQISEQAAAYTA